MMQPTIGRIVHYVMYGTPGGEYPSVCRAAIVTEVGEAHVGLAVMNPEGMFFNRSVLEGEKSEGGTWHWPERME